MSSTGLTEKGLCCHVRALLPVSARQRPPTIFYNFSVYHWLARVKRADMPALLSKWENPRLRGVAWFALLSLRQLRGQNEVNRAYVPKNEPLQSILSLVKVSAGTTGLRQMMLSLPGAEVDGSGKPFYLAGGGSRGLSASTSNRG